MRFPFARPGSLAFVLLLSLAFPVPDTSAASPGPGVTVTEQALPPPEGGTPAPQRLVLPRLPPREDGARWTALDHTLATSYLVLSGADAWQTGHLPAGYREGNPLVSSWAGDRPGFGQALAFKAAMGWGTLALVRRLERPAHRRTVLVLMNVVQASVVAMNERRTGGILFR
jgi:hypothetical protein